MSLSLDYFVVMEDLGKLMGHRIKAIREALGMNQEEFADAMGSSQAHVSRLESGINFKRMSILGEQLHQAGADPMDLLRDPDAAPADPVTAEIRRLLPVVSGDARQAVLATLRAMSPQKVNRDEAV